MLHIFLGFIKMHQEFIVFAGHYQECGYKPSEKLNYYAKYKNHIVRKCRIFS